MDENQLEIRFVLYYTAPHQARALSQKIEEMRPGVFQGVIERPPTYRFDIWDFAGQHMYYTSHQTFLSERAVYLLVVDMSISLDEELSTEIEGAKWKETGWPKRARGTSILFTTINLLYLGQIAPLKLTLDLHLNYCKLLGDIARQEI